MKYLILLCLVLIGCGGSGGESQPEEVAEIKNMLIIGDSISIGYTPYVQENLSQENYLVRRIVNGRGTPENARYSTHGAEHIDRWLSQYGVEMWDVVTFNHGLHDLHDEVATDINAYKDALREVAIKIKAKSKLAIFINTTTVNDVGGRHRENANVLIYNDAAIEVMEELDIPVIDLYSVSVNIFHMIYDDVHFSEEGYSILGNALSVEVLRIAE